MNGNINGSGNVKEIENEKIQTLEWNVRIHRK